MGVEPFQAQAPICPFCFDDHSSLRPCEEKELKKTILLDWFEKFARTKNDDKQDGGIERRIRDMIKWF